MIFVQNSSSKRSWSKNRSTTATPRKFPLHSHSAFKPFARYSDRLLVVACRVQQPEVAVVPLQAPGAELPPPLQTLLRPVRRRLAVEREAAPHLAVLVRRAARPVADADRETSGLPIFRTPRVGLAALSLPWQCEVDKAR